MTHKAVVYLVNDDDTARDSLADVLVNAGMDVEKFASAAEFLARRDSLRPSCLVIDLQASEMSGPSLWAELRQRNYAHSFLLITGPKEIAVTVEAMRQGAFSVLERPVDHELFLAGVSQALEQDAILCQSRQDMADVSQRIKDLTPRQREVMELVVAGRLTKQIARTLAISTKTVEVHRSNITKRMGVESVVQLVKMISTHEVGRSCRVRDEASVAGLGAVSPSTPVIAELPRLVSMIAKPAVGLRVLRPGPAIAGMHAGPIRILIIDDEPADVEIAKRVLWQADNLKFELHSAGNLDLAFEQLRTAAMDVVLLDLGLPKFCGLESLRVLREHNHEIPIVVLTGLRDENTALEALEIGARLLGEEQSIGRRVESLDTLCHPTPATDRRDEPAPA